MTHTVYFLSRGDGNRVVTSDTERAELWSKYGGRVSAVTTGGNDG